MRAFNSWPAIDGLFKPFKPLKRCAPDRPFSDLFSSPAHTGTMKKRLNDLNSALSSKVECVFGRRTLPKTKIIVYGRLRLAVVTG
jgi:hypothetical protein